MPNRYTVKPFIRVDVKNSTIFFNRLSHDLLGKPPYFEFLWSEKKKSLVVVPRFAESPNAMRISKSALDDRRFEIKCRKRGVLDVLNRHSECKETYKLLGEFYAENNLMVFDTTKTITVQGGGRKCKNNY